MLPYSLFDFVDIRMYGICIGVGILACIGVFYLLTKKKKMPSSVQDFVFFVAIVAIAVGFLFAKLYQALYNYIENPAKGFDFYNAGITVMGGLIGGAGMFLATYFGVGHFIFKGEKKGLHIKEFGKVLNVAPICILVAHGFGRVGCLMAGCCHGAYLGQEYVPGGIWMLGATTGVAGYYVPTQLYEALFLFATGGVLSWLYLKKNCNIIMALYLIAYGAWRIFIEFFRDDHVGELIPGLKPSQWQSIIFIALGVALILFYYFKKIPLFNKNKEDDNQPSLEPILETEGEEWTVEEKSNEVEEITKEEVEEVNKDNKSE
ncbi:MAG: prolipoprotein diacylglyceryl transferase [Clostridiales bacterium]|nr:prolipoprotein diacylglyceryl transferase [Clostridiales bacterium]